MMPRFEIFRWGVGMLWYVNANGQMFGPAEEAQVVSWIQSGTLMGGLVCPVGAQQWVDLRAHPPFAAALFRAAPPPLPHGVSVQAVQARAAPAVKKPTNPWVKLVLFVFVLVIVSFAFGVLGILIGAGMIALAVLARRSNRPSFVSWVLKKPPSSAQSVASITIGAVLLIGGLSHLVGSRLSEMEAEKAAQEKQAVAAKRRSDLTAQVPQRVAEWRAKLTQVKTMAEAADYATGGLAIVDAVTTSATQLASDVSPTVPPDLSQIQNEAASARAKYAARANFEQAVRNVGDQFQAAKDQAKAHQYLAADAAGATALGALDTIGAADASLLAFLPTGFDRAAKQREITAFRTQIAGPAAAEKQRAEKAEAARQAKEAKEAAYAAVCGEKPVVSGWDGELIGVASVLKESANDPDSIDVKNCTIPALSSDNCWISTCDVRGKNAFGAKILKRITFSKSKIGFQQISE